MRRETSEDIPTLDPGALDPVDEPVLPVRGPLGRRSTGLTADGRLTTGRLAGLSMRRAIWILCWPILVESFLQSTVGLTDTILAAALPEGDAATTAIGGASYITWFIGLVIMAIGVGATALVSRAVGAGKRAVANAGLGQTILLALTTSLVVGACVALLAGWVARALNMSDPATSAFVVYLRIVAIGVPFTAVLFAGTACARGAGDTRRPLLAMLVVNVVNVVVSWTLAGVDIRRPIWMGGGHFVNPLPFDMGVSGIAIGTITAHVVGAVIILRMARSGVWGIQLKRRWLRPHKVTIWRLVRIGLPNFFETFGLWIGNFFIILMVGWLAREGRGELLGVHVVAIRIEAFSFLSGFAIGTAAATLAGQYIGAQSPAMAKRAVLTCAVLAGSIMGLFSIAFLTLPERIVWLLTEQPIHLEMAPPLVMIAGVVQVPFAIAIVFRSALRGAGDVKVVMLITWLSTYGLRVPLAYLLSGVEIPLPGGGVIHNPSGLEPSLTMLWVGLASEIAIRSLFFSARFIQGGWLNVRV